MKRAARLPILAGVLCCLSTPPAFADFAATDLSAAGGVPVLDTLQVLDGAAGNISSLSDTLIACSFASNAPSSAATTSIGVDSSPAFLGGGFGLSTVAGIAASSTFGSSSPGSAPFSPSSDTPAAAPNVQNLTLASMVGNGIAVSSADAAGVSNPASSASFQLQTESITPQDTTPVPVPPAALLMGAGLLSFLPLRRSSRRCA